jgi:DNA primase
MTCEYSGCNAPEGECMGECLRKHSIDDLQERILEEAQADVLFYDVWPH